MSSSAWPASVGVVVMLMWVAGSKPWPCFSPYYTTVRGKPNLVYEFVTKVNELSGDLEMPKGVVPRSGPCDAAACSPRWPTLKQVSDLHTVSGQDSGRV